MLFLVEKIFLWQKNSIRHLFTFVGCNVRHCPLIPLFHLSHLYSALRILLFCRFSNVALPFSCLGHFPYCVIPLFLRWSHPLTDQLPGEHTGLPSHTMAIPLFCLAFQCNTHLHTHSWQIEVWWLGMFQWTTHSLMCSRHIDLTAQTPAFFMSRVALWEPLVCSYDICHSRTW